MKTIILFLLVNCTLGLYSQSANKEKFIDENGKNITKPVFDNKAATQKYTYTHTQNDTVLITKLILREEFGSLKEGERQQAIKSLERLTGKTLDTTKTIVINFYFKQPTNLQSCINYYVNDKKYIKYFKNNKTETQFFITVKGFNYKKDYVFEDKENVIKDLFFKNELACGNYIIIKPNGHFLRHNGEYRQDEIPKLLNENW